MSTLIESLKAEIARLEAKHGSDDPFVKDLKEQLRASEETDGKTTEEVFKMQAVNFSPALPDAPTMSQYATKADYEEALGAYQERVGRIKGMKGVKKTAA